MNTRLVDSLVQIIDSLSPNERILMQEQLLRQPIQIAAGVCGGHPRIRNTRIPVWTLVSLRQQGADDEELLRNYPVLTKEDLTNAWIYYDQHREEVEQAIALLNNDPPPRKLRDPILTARSKEELLQRQEDYIGGTVKSAARESVRQGTMGPISVRIGKEGKKQLGELQNRLRVEEKILLNMAFYYGYDEAKRNQVSAQELREKIESTVGDEENILFEIDESTLDILFDSGVEDAKFLYLNAGIDLLYCRLVRLDTPSTIWK